MRSKEAEEAIDILQNCIADYVIGDFCVGKYCPMENECIDKDCPFNTAIDKVVAYISELEKENEKYKNFKLHISGMRSGKQLLTRYINDSVLKDKIRDKIKELEEMELDNNDIFGQMRNYAILILKEIIGE
jgi:hypothetical protein